MTPPQESLLDWQQGLPLIMSKFKQPVQQTTSPSSLYSRGLVSPKTGAVMDRHNKGTEVLVFHHPYCHKVDINSLQPMSD